LPPDSPRQQNSRVVIPHHFTLAEPSIYRHRSALFLSVLALACGPSGPPSEISTQGFAAGADDAPLFYRIAGVGRDTLVVVHGFQGNNQNYLAADFDGLFPGHALLFYDQRGAGRSGPVRDEHPDLEDHVEDLEALRLALGFTRLRLLGHSGGAYIAISYALSHPGEVDRIAMVAPGPPTPDYDAEIGTAFTSRLDSATWAELNALTGALPASDAPAAVCQEISSIVMPRVWLADSSAASRMKGSMCDAPAPALRSEAAMRLTFEASVMGRDWTADLGQVTHPVLIVHGDRDAIPVAAAEQWRVALPNGQLVVIPGADHFPWLDRPDAFSRILTDFFEPQ
jgi:proline iminopeptidase